MLVRGAMDSAKILMKNKRLLLGLDTYSFEENIKDNFNKR